MTERTKSITENTFIPLSMAATLGYAVWFVAGWANRLDAVEKRSAIHEAKIEYISTVDKRLTGLEAKTDLVLQRVDRIGKAVSDLRYLKR